MSIKTGLSQRVGNVRRDSVILVENNADNDTLFAEADQLPGLQFVTVKDADSDIGAGDHFVADTSSNDVTMDMPGDPNVNDMLTLTLGIKGSGYDAILNPNGKNIAGNSDSFRLSILNESIAIRYNGTEWEIIARYVPDIRHVVEGRMTLTSGTPITTSDVTGGGTLYFTPYEGNVVRLFDGTDWKYYQFSEVSLSLSGLITTDEIKDVFLYDNSGTLTLELSADWTDDTTRADALVLQDGVWVKSGATTRLHLGTIVGSGSGTVDDAETARYVSNRYNKVLKRAYIWDPTDNNYTTGTTRIYDGDSNNKAHFVLTEPQTFNIGGLLYARNTSSAATGYVGLDSTTTAPQVRQMNVSGPSSEISSTMTATPVDQGKHYIAPLQFGGSGDNYYGMGAWGDLML